MFDSDRRSARFGRMMDRLRTREWIVPTAMVSVAIGLSFAMEALDEHVKGRLEPVWYLFSGGQTIARQFLSALAAAMVAILTMAFSITVTALTFIGQHYGSRVLRSFMQDFRTQFVMGTFLATFVYALLVLRTVHGASDDSSLPRISVTFAIMLAVVSLSILTYFLYHLSERMDAPNIVASIAHDLDRVIDRTTQARAEIEPFYEEISPELPGTAAYVVEAMDNGYIQRIDEEALIEAAASHEAMVRLHCRAGMFMVRGDTLATVQAKPRTETPLCTRIRASIRLGAARSLEQDIEFGIDQLVQVAIRGLSSERNDTFTAMLCLDRLAAALSRLAERDFPPSMRRDRDGCPRLWIRRMRFPDLAHRAFKQIHSLGTAVVSIRLFETLETIARRVGREEDRAALRRHALETHRASRTTLQDSMDIEDVERAFTVTMHALKENPHPYPASEKPDS
ncbi:MAG: hypothetical protein OJF51_000704 [Nitrospira sp.]|jgi:uncharacterized membrane protein|nr:MAG: hypothetical protein OJF51_000704 [Nitrospira sp.]